MMGSRGGALMGSRGGALPHPVLAASPSVCDALPGVISPEPGALRA